MVDNSWDMFQSPRQQNQERETQTPNQPQEQINQEPENSSWGDFQDPTSYQGKIDPKEEESTFGYVARNLAANASRVGEQIAGRAGNLEQFGKHVLKKLPESSGILGWALSKLVGEDNWERMVEGTTNQQMFPTSQELKEFSHAATGGYTKAKTKGEERFQEKVEDVASTVTGRNVRNPTIRGIALNNVLTPVAANVAKDITVDLGFGENAGNVVKTAVWLPLSLAFNVNASQYASNLMNQGRNGFNQNLQVNVPRYQTQLDRVANTMLHNDPGSALAQQQIAGIRNDLAAGQTGIRDLLTRYDAVNRAKRDRGLFALHPGDRRAAIRNINQVRDVVRGEIEHLGASNPQALIHWQNGVQAWATIHRSNSISNWVESVAKGPYAKMLTGPAAALFGVGSVAAAKAPIIAGPAAAASAAAYKSGQVMYRMWNDPTLSQYYWNAIAAAQRKNLPAFLSNYDKLNKKLKESDSVKPENESKNNNI